MQKTVRLAHDAQWNSWRVLSLAVASALLAPGVAWSADGGQRADGEVINLSRDTYRSTEYADHVLYAFNGGGFNTVAGTSLISSGDAAYGAQASGAGSFINLVGTTVSTSGNTATALWVRDGAHLTVMRGAGGERTVVTTTGYNAMGVLARGAAANAHVEGSDISTSGRLSHGFSVEDGATGELLESTVRTRWWQTART